MRSKITALCVTTGIVLTIALLPAFKSPSETNSNRIESAFEQAASCGVGISLRIDQHAELAHDGTPFPVTNGDYFPVIVRVFAGSSAWCSGIRAGDAIVSVDGRSTLRMSFTELVEAIRGERGTLVTLQVQSMLDDPVTLQRAPLVSSEQLGRHLQIQEKQ